MLHDVRHAWRAIRGMPVVVSVVVASLGVGIGVNTAVFSWVQAIVLRPLPGVADSASLRLGGTARRNGLVPRPVVARYGDLRERLQSFSDLIAFRMVPFTVGEPGRVERAYALLVSPQLLHRARTPAGGRPLPAA